MKESTPPFLTTFCRITPDARCKVPLRYAIFLFATLALTFPAGSFGQQGPNTAAEVTPRYDSLHVSSWKECLRLDPVSCPAEFKAMVESQQEEGQLIAPELLMLYRKLRETEARLGRELTPLYENLDGSNWEECLRLDPVFCPTVLKAEVESLQKEGIEVPAELQLLYDRLKGEEGGAPGTQLVENQCGLFGQMVMVTIPNCDPFSSGSQQVLYWIGDENCNGRCGAGCPSSEPDCVDSAGAYRYTTDCIVHDACGDVCGLENLDCQVPFLDSADDCTETNIDCCQAYSTRDGPTYWDTPPTQSDMPVEGFCSGGPGRNSCAPCFKGEGECTASSQCSGTLTCEADSPFNTCSDAAPTAPDLIVTGMAVSDTTLETGQLFTASATVQNQGSGSSASTTLRYYQSTDPTISTSDTELSTDPVPSLGPGNSVTESDSETINVAGTFWIGACVDAVSGESNTGNNCSTGVQVTVSSCAAPENLVLSDDTILTTEVFEACNSITVGPNFLVMGPSGNVTFRAGVTVVFRDGFEVTLDGIITVEIGPLNP